MSRIHLIDKPQEKPDRASKDVASLFHPRWSPAWDMRLLSRGETHADRAALAKEMKTTELAVQQRLHRLRAIRNCAAKLEAFGLTRSYPGVGT